MHSTAKITGKRTLKGSEKMTEREEVSKGVREILRTKEVRGISQKRKGKKTKRYVPRLSNCGAEGYWNIIYY